MSQERAASEAGVVTKLSQRSVAGTVSRLAEMIADKGMTLFAAIDQKAAASQAGLDLRETVLVIFDHRSPDLQAKLAGIDPLTDALVTEQNG
jgi:uncharacterized protein (DUF302 family)